MGAKGNGDDGGSANVTGAGARLRDDHAAAGTHAATDTIEVSGSIKWFDAGKGFGFIVEDDSKQEIFVHHSGLIDKIRENDLVSYEVTEGRKGLNAVNVKRMQ